MSGGGGSGSGSAVNQSSGCFNGILRRLLCTGSAPTHPSDQIAESNTTQLVKSTKDPNLEPKIQASSAGSVTPGIVARLMGLESLPETKWVSKRMAPDLVKRSRSVSFADYLMGFDLGDHEDRDQQHRRVKTSVSFREAPAVRNHQKSPDFVVVYLDNVDKAKEVGKKVEKPEVGFGGLKQGRKKEQRSKQEENRESNEVVKKNKEKIVRIKQNKKIDRLKDEPRRESSAQSSPKPKGFKSASYRNGGSKLKKESEHLPVKKATQKKKVVVEPKIKKKHEENSAAKEKEDRSPVSVLDIDDILIEHEAWLSGYSMPMDLNSKVKSSPKASYDGIQEATPAKRRDFEPIKDEESREYAELLAMKIQKWTGEDLKESNWVVKNADKLEGLEEICVELEGMMLDVLLDQAIDGLVEISHDNLWTCYD